MKYKFNKDGTRVTAYKPGERISTTSGKAFSEEIKVATILFPPAAMSSGTLGSNNEKTARHITFIENVCNVTYEAIANDEDKREITAAIPKLRQQCFARCFTEMMISVAEISAAISDEKNPVPNAGLSDVMEKVCRPKTINKFLFPHYSWEDKKPLDKTIEDLEIVLTFLKKLRQLTSPRL